MVCVWYLFWLGMEWKIVDSSILLNSRVSPFQKHSISRPLFIFPSEYFHYSLFNQDPPILPISPFYPHFPFTHSPSLIHCTTNKHH